MQHGNQHLRLCCDGPVKMNGASFRTRFQGSLEPFGEQGEVVTDFELDFFWPREGLVVRRTYQAARWYDGRLFVWSGNRASVGRGEASSGLAFDDLDG